GTAMGQVAVKQPITDSLYGEITASDPAEFEQAVRPWDTLCLPLSRGAFNYRMAYFVTPSFTFYRETYANSVSIKGMAPPDMLAFSVPLLPGQDSKYWNSTLEHPGFPGTLPGGLDVVFSKGHDHFVVLIALDLLHRMLPAVVVENLMRAASNHFLPSSVEGVRHFGTWLLNCLSTVNQYPQMLQQPHVLQSLEQELIAQLANTVTVTNSPTTRPRTSVRERALNRALDHLYGDIHGELTIAELCQITEASQRTLEYAFQETFDMTPREFLKLRRLHAARRALLATNSGEGGTVSEIAYAHGFYELGRFAGIYKQAFGELPSATLIGKQ
ncbi:MAG: helix-turn-helix domain-containing protein, partial [Gammaproteobacteria bacterium]|nr:helix-turn-helix domain-containing protein [Gammaproteobacteria bacterium]